MEITTEILRRICEHSGDGEMEDVAYDSLVYVHDAASKFDIGGTEVWVPFSVLHDITGGILTVAKWFADQEELV